MKTYIKIAIVVICSLVCTRVSAEPTTTPKVVSDFYNSILKLQNAANDSEAFDIEEKMKCCFLYYDQSGIIVPNDFYEFGYNDYKTLNSNVYVQRCKNKCYEESNKRLKVVVKISPQSEYAREIDLKQYKSENEPYVETHVTKTFTLGNTVVSFNDTILSRKNYIEQVRNAISSGSDIGNIESLKALAASYSSSKQYRKAYDTYKKIIVLDPANSNAFYRLGILAFWYGKECGLSSKKIGREEGMNYMQLAKKLYFSRAEQVYYYMTHAI